MEFELRAALRWQDKGDRQRRGENTDLSNDQPNALPLSRDVVLESKDKPKINVDKDSIAITEEWLEFFFKVGKFEGEVALQIKSQFRENYCFYLYFILI